MVLGARTHAPQDLGYAGLAFPGQPADDRAEETRSASGPCRRADSRQSFLCDPHGFYSGAHPGDHQPDLHPALLLFPLGGQAVRDPVPDPDAQCLQGDFSVAGAHHFRGSYRCHPDDRLRRLRCPADLRPARLLLPHSVIRP